jgi:hypothetical protein
MVAVMVKVEVVVTVRLSWVVLVSFSVPEGGEFRAPEL